MAGNEVQVLSLQLEKVADKVTTLFDRDDTFYSQIEKRPVEVISGRDMRIPLEIRPGGSFGYVNLDGGDLGRGDAITFDKAVINTVTMRHAIEITTKSIWTTDNSRKAVLDAFKTNMSRGMAEFRRNVDSQCMTDGTAVVGTITSVTTAAGVDTYTLSTDGYRARLMRFGQRLNVFSSSLLVCRTAGGMSNETSVTMLDLTNNTIQVTPAVAGAVAGDVLVSSGVQTTPPVGLLGVKYHNNAASTGTWLGFDRALNPEIRANRVNGNGSSLTLALPRLAINKIGDRLGIDQNSKLQAWTHPAQKNAYEEIGFNVTRIDKSDSDNGLNLYFGDNMRLAGAPVKTSFSWDRTRIDFLDTSLWGRAELKPADFYKNPDSSQRVWEIRGGSGGVATAWVFYIICSFNLYCSNPAGSSYIDNLAVPAGY